jgi:hypothetical protein
LIVYSKEPEREGDGKRQREKEREEMKTTTEAEEREERQRRSQSQTSFAHEFDGVLLDFDIFCSLLENVQQPERKEEKRKQRKDQEERTADRNREQQGSVGPPLPSIGPPHDDAVNHGEGELALGDVLSERLVESVLRQHQVGVVVADLEEDTCVGKKKKRERNKGKREKEIRRSRSMETKERKKKEKKRRAEKGGRE